MSDEDQTISKEYCAHLLSRTQFFSTIPWQKRIYLCSRARCIRVQAQDQIALGPGIGTDSRVAETEALIVLSGSSTLELQSYGPEDTLGDAEEEPVSTMVIDHLNSGVSIVLSTLESKELHKLGTFCARAERTEAVWMLISVKAYKEIHVNDMKLGRRATTLLNRNALVSRNLPENLIALLAEDCKLEKYPAGTKLLRAWEPAPCIYFVESGECLVQTGILGVASSNTCKDECEASRHSKDPSTNNGDRLSPENWFPLQTLKHGQCFGDASATSNQRMWASLVTKTDCKVQHTAVNSVVKNKNEPSLYKIISLTFCVS